MVLYVRFPQAMRNVEDLLHERRIDICHETVRQSWMGFGTCSLERSVGSGIPTACRAAVTGPGRGLREVQRRCSEGHRRHVETGLRHHLNNRPEDSHLPFRRRERAMLRFRRMRSPQKVVAVHASVGNHFNLDRSHSRRQHFKLNRTALAEWRQLGAA